jgi:hypothetical protein
MTRSYPNVGPHGPPCIWSVRGHERFYLRGEKRIFVMVVTPCAPAQQSFFFLGDRRVAEVGPRGVRVRIAARGP